jgi:carboxyl-terminal processing protease
MELGEDSLEHAMLWDEIAPAEVAPTIDVTALLPILKERSEKRTAEDEHFTSRNELVARFGERRQRKTVTLQQAKRQALMDEEEEWAERIRKITQRRRDSGYAEEPKEEDGDAPANDKEESEDLILEEALQVMADMISFGNAPLVATPAEKPAG